MIIIFNKIFKLNIVPGFLANRHDVFAEAEEVEVAGVAGVAAVEEEMCSLKMGQRSDDP